MFIGGTMQRIIYALKILIITILCFNGHVYAMFGKDEDEFFDQQNKSSAIKLKAPRQEKEKRELSTVTEDMQALTLKFLEELEVEEELRFNEWQARYGRSHKLMPDVPTSNQQYESTHSTLKGEELPLAYTGEVYLKGSSHKKVIAESKRVDTSYVAPTHMNYVQRTEGSPPTYEVFGVPQAKDTKIGKGEYGRHQQPEFVELYSISEGKMVIKKKDKRKIGPNDDELVFDPGHGIDHAITVTFKGSNSNKDVNNYTPQNAYYNRSIRNPLVGYAHDKSYSYKEIAIYPEHPLMITRVSKSKKELQPIPEGFVVFLLDHEVSGNIVQAYYFPNFYHYAKKAETVKGEKPWEYFLKRYAISKETAAEIWGKNEISDNESRRVSQYLSEHVGYRALSGRYEILPEGIWNSSAKNALVRTVGIYRIQRAAEFDTSIENMLAIASMFYDGEFQYEEFKGTLRTPGLGSYWLRRGFRALKENGFRPEDVAHFMYYESELPLKPTVMPYIIRKHEEKLQEAPDVEHIVRLLEFFDEKGLTGDYDRWSEQLSELVKKGIIPGSIVITEKMMEDMVYILSDLNIFNIIFDFEITSERLKLMYEGFKQRALKEESGYICGLKLIEFTQLSPRALKDISRMLTNGIEIDLKKKVYVDVRRAALKTPFKREQVKSFVKNTGMVVLD